MKIFTIETKSIHWFECSSAFKNKNKKGLIIMKLYEVKKKYLADALSYLGFRYYKKGFGVNTIYTFENTEKFSKAMTKLNLLKEEINNM